MESGKLIRIGLLLAGLVIIGVVCLVLLIFFPAISAKLENFRGGFGEEKAKASIYLEEVEGQKQIWVALSIPDSKVEDFNGFVERLGLQDKVRKFGFKLNEESVENLGKILPLDLELEIKGRELIAASEKAPRLVSSSLKERIDYATGGGRLELKYSKGLSEIEMSVNEPRVLLNQATLSGRVFLAAEVADAERVLKNVDSVYIRVNGKNVYGQVVLK